MTIKDLAAQTGYSVGTISRVLNHQPNVSDKARQIVLRAAAESGFQLNTNAKQLKQQHGTAILMVVKGTSNELFARLVEAIQSQSKHPLVVDYIDENENEVRRALRLCPEKKPLGILFLGGNREHLLADFGKISVPAVLVTNDASGLPFENLSSVSADNVLAARMAIENLVSQGHRKFALIGGRRQVSDTTTQRYQGCLEAFAANQIAFDGERDYETARFSCDGGYRAAQALLHRNQEFTALFAMSDVMAIGAIRALQDAGKRVPEDVAVMGFDGLDIGEYTVPRLATVRQSPEALAQTSLELLQAKMEAPCPPIHKTVPVHLVPRESAGHTGGIP